MTTSPYVCSAPAGFEIAYVVNENELLTTPMVAWELTGLQAVPLALFPVANVIAVIFPDGQVVDLDSRETWSDVQSWRDQWREVDCGPERKVKALSVDKAPGADLPQAAASSRSLRDLGLSGRAIAPMHDM